MQDDTLRLVGVVLCLVGAGTGVCGIGWYQSGSDCDPYYLEATTSYSGYADTPVVTYESLTADQQRAARQTLADEDNYRGVSRAYFPQQTRVRYEGDTYLVTTAAGGGCQSVLNFMIRVLPSIAGAGGVFGGVSLLYRSRQRDA